MTASLESVFPTPTDRIDTEPTLLVRDLSVRFGGVFAVDSVDFEVHEGELLAVIGPNGAGKTTLLNAISRLVPSSGQITFRDHALNRRNASTLAGLGIGRSFQDPQLVEQYSVLDNVLCGAHTSLSYGLGAQLFRNRKVRRAELQAIDRARALLVFAAIDQYENTVVSQLSYGVRKLVDIVRAMVNGPRLLLLDEPSSGLDSAERSSLAEMLLRLREGSPVAMLVVEHHMDLVRTVASRLLALQGGEVLMTGTPSDVLRSTEFRNALLGTSVDGAGPLTGRSQVGADN